MRKVLLCVCLLCAVTGIYSYDINISVIDKDIDIPLEGVKLTLIKTGNSVSTDSNGSARITIGDDQGQIVVVAFLNGYETKRFVLKKAAEVQIVSMSIQGVLEGQGLVVERKALQIKDEKSGVSTMVDKQEIKQTTKGPLEDIMTTIKTLPGVSYAGKFSSRPSVRGGHPSEVSALLDGFLIRMPYHWGGAFSIFNPNIIESVKFSNGVFSARYGVAMSGLIEVNSTTPDQGVRFDGILSTTTAEAFLQLPLWKNSGLFVGGRVTYLDPVLLIAESAVTSTGTAIQTAPYIRDASFKWFWKPHERVEWYINSFFGSDGVALKNKDIGVDDTKTIVSDFNFGYYKYNTFVVTGVKFLPVDRLFIHILAGYEFLLNGVDGKFNENGTKNYSQEFKDQYAGFKLAMPTLPDINDSFSVKNLGSNFARYDLVHSAQTRIDFDITLHERVQFSCGAGLLYDNILHSESGKMYSIIPTQGFPLYSKITVDLSVKDNLVFNSFTFINFLFTPLPGVLEIEAGVRVDHFYMQGNDVSLNTYPVPNPRLMISYTPVRDKKYINSLTLSLGVGLFSKIPLESSIIEKKYGIDHFEVHQPKSLTAITGVEINLPLDFKIKVEGYYKYYFDRFYFNLDTTGNQTKFLVHSDGIGHAAGFDVLLQRKISRWVDGWISYSFIFAKYYNPETDNMPSKTTFRGEPTGTWYYPSYHRWHNMNIVLNIKPVTWFTISLALALASGNPKKSFETEMFPVLLEDGQTVLEMYRDKGVYTEKDGDSLRTGFSIPLDLTLRFNVYFPKSKVKMEAYVSVEDIFVMVYSDQVNAKSIDKYTGKESTGQAASFSVGIPIPSIGIKINF